MLKRSPLKNLGLVFTVKVETPDARSELRDKCRDVRESFDCS
jgi:hypothetical protein